MILLVIEMEIGTCTSVEAEVEVSVEEALLYAEFSQFMSITLHC